MSEFEAFFAEHYGEVSRALLLVCGDTEAAREAAQEAFARAYANWDRVSTFTRPVGWVYVVGMNHLRSAGRRRRVFGRIRRSLLSQPPQPNDLSVVHEVREAICRLPPRGRTAVILRYYVDLSIADIAKVMGCREGTVKSTLHAAQATLRESLEPFGVTEKEVGTNAYRAR